MRINLLIALLLLGSVCANVCASQQEGIPLSVVTPTQIEVLGQLPLPQKMKYSYIFPQIKKNEALTYKARVGIPQEKITQIINNPMALELKISW
jgi:hypothetical protein